jgi:hypothetical protein
VFGSSTVARDIVAKAKQGSSRKGAKKTKKEQPVASKGGKSAKAGLRIGRMKTVTETAKFAGQTIE